MSSNEPLRVGQFSAYYGDRLDAMGQLLDSGVDVLTGDYLAELTMLVLRKNQMRGAPGYATGFVEQLRPHLGRIQEQGVRVVSNAGGLEPEACAQAIRDLCTEAGVELKVAALTGDDVVVRLSELHASGEEFQKLYSSETLAPEGHEILTANAYLGGWPIAAALEAGADIVVCPRVTDASLVIGPASWHFGWQQDEWDKLAGALWAGHAIECGAQVTGGQFSLFFEHDDLGLPGYPIAEILENGDSVVTKAAGTGGLVSVDTVRAQLVYEVGGARYENPDVAGDLSSLTLTQDGPDRVRISGARGLPPTDKTKLSLCYEGGYRNTVTVGLTGGKVEQKKEWLLREVEKAVGKADEFDQFRVSVVGPAATHGQGFDGATALVAITARDQNRERVSRAGFSDRITQLGVSNIPGFYTLTPPQRERLVGVQWPCLISKHHLTPSVVMGDGRFDVGWGPSDPSAAEAFRPADDKVPPAPETPSGNDTRTVEFGDVFGTRSGDKGGMANLGVWARTADAYAWLVHFLTVERLSELMPELEGLRVERHVLPNLFAMNFLLHDYLELGVASCTRIDAQAKGVGEYLGAMPIILPESLVGPARESE